MCGALARAAERWRSVKVTDFEHRQTAAIRKELDEEYEAQLMSSKDGTVTKNLGADYFNRRSKDMKIKRLYSPNVGFDATLTPVPRTA